MTSLQRTRSLRQQAAEPTELPAPAQTSTDPRNASPSRLPQFHSRSRSTVTASNTSNPTTATVKPRPASGQLRRAPSTKASGTSITAGQEPAKRETTRYPPSTTVTRPQVSHARPGSSGSAAPVKRTAAHTRAKSTTASVNASTVLRPPSRDKAAIVAPAPRATATHRRNASVDKRPTATAAVQTPTKPAAQAPQPRLRPAFSTLQQHYSPAKSLGPKPLTATYLAPPSPSKLPANIAASAETNRLQAELLQLQLLHRDAPVAQSSWQEDAKKKLGDRYARLNEASQDVNELERDRAEAENVLALRRWSGEDGRLEQKLQVLDGVVNGVWALSDAGGRYARTVRRFERWVDRVNELEEARRSGTALSQANANLFIGELEASWKEECPGLIRRLEGWERQLKDMGSLPRPPDDGSRPASLIRMLVGCESLIRNMRAELAVMQEIELEALEREDAWIERVNREDDDNDTPKAGAIWRSF
ncbi:hypothetical protein LIA77_04426 [Sarocladium implicatum]|nr:hypothetical protein LIA77_04426 [Sarocladium implicatum]